MRLIAVEAPRCDVSTFFEFVRFLPHQGHSHFSPPLAVVKLILNGGYRIQNVVVNGAEGLTFSGGDNVPARVAVNHYQDD